MPKIRFDAPAILIAASFGLSIFVTWLAQLFYIQVGIGYVDKGFPLAWQRIYGGVTVQTNYSYLFLNIIIWTVVLFLTLVAVTFYLRHRRKR
jgi:hypothetical protein